ncbi:MAG: PQQ-dependent sugar dehydrogenase [Telluria sp.]
MRHDQRKILLGLVLGLSALPALAELEPTGAPPPAKGWRAETVAEGIREPWGMAWLPDGRLLITSKRGTLHVLNGKRFDAIPLEGLPEVYTGGQGGLLDIALHPGDKANVRVYMTMASGTDSANRTILVQGVFDGKRVHGIETLFRAQPDKGGGEHFGSRLVWLPDGTLLMSVGDGGNPPRRVGAMLAREQAQNLGSHHGAILRLTAEGRAAPGNPLASRPGALPEIWSYGHRNIQGLMRDPQSGRVWASEHGPRGGDEVNLIEGGRNYGWPLQSYGRDYRTGEPVGQRVVAGMVAPKAAWVPSPAPSGLTMYTGSHFPQWRGSLFSGSLAGMDIRRIELDKDANVVRQERLDIGKRVRDVRQGPDGYLYAITDEENGRLLRIVPE